MPKIALLTLCLLTLLPGTARGGCLGGFFKGLGEKFGLKRDTLRGEAVFITEGNQVAPDAQRQSTNFDYRQKSRRFVMDSDVATRGGEKSAKAASEQLQANGVAHKVMHDAKTNEWYVVITPGTATPANRFALSMKNKLGTDVVLHPKALIEGQSVGVFFPKEKMLVLPMSSIELKQGGALAGLDPNATFDIRVGRDMTGRHEIKHANFEKMRLEGDITPYHGTARMQKGAGLPFKKRVGAEVSIEPMAGNYHDFLGFEEMATHQLDLGTLAKDIKKGYRSGRNLTEIGEAKKAFKDKMIISKVVARRSYAIAEETLSKLETSSIEYLKDGKNIVAHVTVVGQTGTYTLTIPLKGATKAKDTARNFELLADQLTATKKMAIGKIAVFDEAERAYGLLGVADDATSHLAYAEALDLVINGKKGNLLKKVVVDGKEVEVMEDLGKFTDDYVAERIQEKNKAKP